MGTTAPAYTFGGITRPALNFDDNGNIILDPAAASFAAEYGIKALYMGLPASTPYPPVAPVAEVAPTIPVDVDNSPNKVAQGATTGTHTGLTVAASDVDGKTVTYSLASSANGAFAINASTGVVTVADPTKINYATSGPSHAYNITVVASDGTLTSSQSFSIAVTPGAATHFTVSIPAGGTAGTPGSVSVTAFDAFGNVATGYSGTVHFTSSDPHAVLPANVTLTNGIGTFSETLETSGNQTVTATDTVQATITGTSNADAVTPGAATHFGVSIPASGTAGTPGSITVTALDAFGNVAPSYTGTAHFTSSDGLATLPANYTFTGGDAGVHTFTSGEILRTSGSQTVMATDTVTSAMTGTSNADVVTPAAATHFTVSIPANGTAGTPGSLVVTAIDAFGNVATGYTGTVHFTSTDGSAVLPANATLTNGTGTFSETLDTAGNQTVTATDTVAPGITGTSNGDAVTPGPPHFIVSIPANDTAGTAGSVTVSVVDAFGNVETGYLGTVHFTSSDPQAVLPANYTFTGGDAGVHTFASGEILKTSGSQTVTATDTVSATITGTSTELVTPAAATHFSVGIPATEAAGTAESLIVTALDAFGNVATGYSGTVHFTSTDSQAGLPADMTLTNGVGTFSETLKTTGNQTITATDTVTSSINGTSNIDAVAPAMPPHFVFSIPANGTAGTPGLVTVSALDAFGNVDTGYSGTVHFTSSDPQAVLPADTTLTNGISTFSETLDTSGNQTITATDTAQATITGTSNTETVVSGAATHFAVSIPASATAGTAGLATVTALDAFNNVATGYTGTVHFTSSDGSAVLPADATLTNGTGTFSETLDTSGSQTITATDTVTSGITGTSNADVITPGAATHFTVSIPPSGTAGTAGLATVTALDAFDNVVTGYAGTVHFTSSDGQAVLPADATLTNGAGTFSETLDTSGNQTISATDTVSAGITGTSNTEVVAPGAATHFSVSIPANGRADNPGLVTVTALDAHGNVASGYTGTVHFTSSDGSAVLPTDMTLTNGVGTFSETFETIGSQTITATDTVSAGITGTSNTETVGPADAAPVVTAGHSFTYTEGQAAAPFDTALTVTDADSPDLAHVTVHITAGYINGEDVLGFTDTAAITHSFDAATGTLTLTGSATPAQYQAALQSVTYVDTSQNPSTLDRTVTIVANDGTVDSTPVTDTIHVLSVDNPPVVTVGAITDFSEPPNGTPAASSAPVTIAPNLTISDVDSTDLTSATFVLNDLKPSDALSVSGHAGSSGTIGGIGFAITSTATTETVTFTGTDTLAHYASALDLVQFNNTSENPDTTARSYTITAVDDGSTANGGNPDGTATATQTVTAVNDAPTETVPADSSIGTAFSHTNLAISGLSVADVDAGSGTETATIASSHGALNFTTTGLSGSTNNGSHSVTLTGTIAQVNTALATLTYNSDDGFTGTDTVTLKVNDNGNTGTPGPQTSATGSFDVGVVPQVFYIDNSSGGTNAGTQANPYTSIAAFNAANPAGSGDYVVLEHGTGTYSEANGINLANGVNLIGGSQTLQFTNPVTSQVVTANTGSGTDPIIKVSSGSDSGIDLLTGTAGHTISHISIDTTAGTGAGISDDGNNVGTVAMSDIVVHTTSGAGMNFTHGGTITATGTNSITSTTGTALDVVNTTIGSSGLTFHDISANGGTNGIVLNTTGSSGGLTVTGGGNTSSGGDASGGTIQSTTGDGIVLTSTSNVSLADMNVHNTAGDGINGTAVTGFTLSSSTFNTDGTSVSGIGQGDVYFTGLSGSAAVTASVLTGAAYDALHVFNDSGQTLNRITVTGSTFGTNSAAGNASNDAIGFEATGGTFNATVQNSTVTSARGDQMQLNLLGTVSSDLVVTGNTFNNTNQNIVSGGGGLTFGGGGPTNDITLTYNISNNTIKGAHGADIAVTKGTGTNAAFTGTISGNTIGTQGVDGSGSTQGEGIAVFQDGAGTSSTTVTNNHISGVTDAGIQLLNHNGGGGEMTGVVQGNTIDTLDQVNTFAGIYLQTGSNTGSGGDNNKSDLTVGGPGVLANHVDIGTNANDAIVSGIFLEQEGVSKVGLLGSPNYSGAPYDFNAVASYVAANNVVTSAGSGTLQGGATATAAIGDPNTPAGGGYFGGAQFLLAAPGGVQASTPTPGVTDLTQAELDSVVAAAIANWAAAGASASQLAALHATTFSIADLSGNIIGEETSPAHITIDTNADGNGWFVDPTPTSNSEFTRAQNAARTDLLTDPSNAAAGHMDLLTTVVHELGHVLGLPDSTSSADVNDLMYINLVDGERRLPDAADVASAIEASLPPAAQAPAGTPIVAGTAGNDIIDAGHVGAILFGGAGADRFVFDQATLASATAPMPQVDHVADYSAAQGDTIDLTALFSAASIASANPLTLVHVAEDASGKFAELQVNTAAAGKAAH
jgi:hypothetical protein